MNKKCIYKNIILIASVFLLFALGVVFCKLLENKRTLNLNINKNFFNQKMFDINIKSGDLIKNNFKVLGTDLNQQAFPLENGKIAQVVLWDMNNKILGKADLRFEKKDEQNRNCFEARLSYNQTKEKEGIVEIKSISKDNQREFSYKIKVKLDNKPLNLNQGFIPKDGTPFVAGPSFDPPAKK
ncbi:hypothetical protein CSB11_01145 [Candidatus Campbellbacteria bacterium]|nr:MAG: hypothetical protein CSB11_01145 [Candidatus Campbellbacteria bacterium]